MKVKIYDSITEIGKKEWDSIVGKNHLICTYKYLEAIEKSQINDCRYYYPVIYDRDEIIAHACIYFISTKLDTFARGITKKIINLIRRKWKGFLILNSLECGTPVALGSTISFKNGVDKVAVIEQICQEIEDLAKKFRIKVVLFRDFYDEELSLYDHLIKLGYKRVHNLPNTTIEIRWNNFDEYLNSMRSNYKKKIKKRMEKCYRGNITVEIFKNFSNYADELEKLWMNVYGHAKEYKRERLSAIFFRNIDKCLGDCSAVILAKKDNIPIGFTLLLFDDETLIPMYSGLDYNCNKEYYIYFNLLYKIVEVGIKEGMKDIDMGITTLIPKKDIGANVAPLYVYMKHFNPLLNGVIPKVFDLMTPQDNIKSRNVFKN